MIVRETLTAGWHERAGRELKNIGDYLETILYAMQGTKSVSAEAKSSVAIAVVRLKDVRRELEEVFFKDHPDDFTLRAYFEPNDPRF